MLDIFGGLIGQSAETIYLSSVNKTRRSRSEGDEESCIWRKRIEGIGACVLNSPVDSSHCEHIHPT